MSQDMRSDVGLLCALLDESPLVRDRLTGYVAPLSAKLLAHWTDRSIQTVSDYRTGKTNIPAEFWKRFLEHYYDPRVIVLFIPGSVIWEAVTTEGIDAVTAPAFFREALHAEAQYHEQQTYLANILADGRVDELDASTVVGYHDAFHRHRHTDAQLFRAIVAHYNKTTLAKAAKESQP